ncbi:hypothetical protein MM_2559 [Methanosarcina mazei Go1]|uniref:GmrSD restriction endonucleases N-terminal domain-containing protein n=1 Tax=Methanosarcina mazei (strain ATCC BAA-159 / DSM 3647 / Goe1 / Go1 / JCM 11833 / OCM 88) TaxID=192952 RepID=Q8PTZ8_METMA|nr:DUF262 domain-containing protein [Methanosarcina mazei]AAM32255.1 hypothetical protein MM_2559 [Methanosarcina mazei Go1]WIM45965.1 DUF262 domain-containing protein [Methanosarcina mazei]
MDEPIIEDVDDEDTNIAKKNKETNKETRKQLVTQKMDIFIPSLRDMIKNEVINLSPRFQRRDRWNQNQQSKLIESVIMAVPIPPVFLAEEELGYYSVMDGKQRLTAIEEYLEDKYVLKGLKSWADLNGKKFSQLDPEAKGAITRRMISAIVILKESNLDIKFDVFERINTGGEHLNFQEIRNCIHQGKLNDTLIELSENTFFRKCLNLPESKEELSKIKIYQQMEDVQLVLRFFLLQDYKKMSGNLKSSLNNYMKNHKNITENELEAHRRLFNETIEKVYGVYGNQSFRKWEPQNNLWSSRISAPFYDAVMYGFSKIDRSLIEGNKNKILDGTKRLFEDSEFLDSIRKGTNSTEANNVRIEKFLSMLNSSVGLDESVL